MIYPEELVSLLKKHGYWMVSLWLFIVACVSLVLFIVFTSGIALVNVVWCCAGIYGCYVVCVEKESDQTTKEKLADTVDKLCIAEHEIEGLKLELEIYKSAEQTKEPKGQLSESVTPLEEKQPKTRKPAPRRKPRPKTGNKE